VIERPSTVKCGRDSRLELTPRSLWLDRFFWASCFLFF